MLTHADQEITIEPHTANAAYWSDLWRYRELLYFLAWRDILVRYKQTSVGIAWAVIRPVLTMAIFVFIFGRIAGLDSGGIPYPILVCSAMLPWQLFSNSLSEASSSLIGNSNLIAKIYFPRMLVPMSTIAVNVVDFLITALILLAMMVYYQVSFTWRLLFIPLFTALALFAAAGPGIGFAALNVRYRDFRYVIPFVLQLAVYLSPVAYTTANVPERYRLLYSLNPMVAVIEGFRWCVSGQEAAFPWFHYSLGIAVMALLLIVGIRYFRSVERTLADRI